MAAAIESVGIVGGGLMGSGIAESVARAGLPVRVRELDSGPLQRARERLDASLARGVKGGKLEVAEAAEVARRIEWTTSIEELADCDLVIEAVVEDPRVKGEVFQRLDSLLAPEALMASNTSSIPIAQLASWTERPDRVLGMHFFSPAQVMKLVELVVGIETSERSLDRKSVV